MRFAPEGMETDSIDHPAPFQRSAAGENGASEERYLSPTAMQALLNDTSLSVGPNVGLSDAAYWSDHRLPFQRSVNELPASPVPTEGADGRKVRRAHSDSPPRGDWAGCFSLAQPRP